MIPNNVCKVPSTMPAIISGDWLVITVVLVQLLHTIY